MLNLETLSIDQLLEQGANHYSDYKDEIRFIEHAQSHEVGHDMVMKALNGLQYSVDQMTDISKEIGRRNGMLEAANSMEKAIEGNS